MKIKMTTTAVDNKLLCYNFGKVFTVGENIEKEFAKSLVASNLAIVIEEEKEVPKEVKKKTRAKNKDVKVDEV